MAREFTSRLARRQGKNITRQSMLMIALAIIGSLLFFFIVMPQVVQLFFRVIGGGDLGLTQEDTVPPQVPVIAPPPEATNQSSVTIKGYGEAKSEVVLVVNGEERQRQSVNEAGEFELSFDLSEGENAVNLYGVDDAENESTTRDFLIVFDKIAPTLAFEDLENNKQITLKQNQNLTIRGETEPESQLTLNERNVYVNSDGTFSTVYFLQEGDNNLKFIVIDQAGNRSEREVKINFRY